MIKTHDSERDFWEQNIKAEAIRAGIDPSGTVGCATLHLIGEKAQQADRREAGRDQVASPAGSASPSAYQQKLAEAMASKIDPECHYDILVLIDRLAAVLASEGVVDPVELSTAVDGWNKAEIKVERLEAELGKCRATHINAVELLHEANLAGTTVTGMEQAAKIAEKYRATSGELTESYRHHRDAAENIAAAIRADKERDDG